MYPLIIESFTPHDTEKAAFALGGKAQPGEIYLLSGQLGAGKTVFAKGFAAGLQIAEAVVSPTFTIMNTYVGRLNFYHFDMYRIHDPAELINIGAEEFFYGDGVCLIEWPEMAVEILPENSIHISIIKDYTKGEDYRTLTISKSMPTG